jgi:sensor histidine kinase YesM
MCLAMLCTKTKIAYAQNTDSLVASTLDLVDVSTQINNDVYATAHGTRIELMSAMETYKVLNTKSKVSCLSWAHNTLLAGTTNGAIEIWQLGANKEYKKQSINTGFNYAIISMTVLGGKFYFTNDLGTYLLDTNQRTAEHISVPLLVSNELTYSLTNIGDSVIYGIKNHCLYKAINEKLYLQKLPCMLADSCTIQYDAYGNIWLPSDKQGIVEFNIATATSKMITDAQGLVSNKSKGLALIGLNLVAVVYENSFNLVNVKTNQISTHKFEQTFTGKLATQSKYLLLGTTEGTQQYMLPVNLQAQFGCDIKIEAQDASGKYLVNKAALGSEHNSISFRFNYSIANTDQQFVRYQLINHTDNWHTTNDPQIFYNQLEPGTYMFQVQVANNPLFNNACSEQFLFSIEKKWYKKVWFACSVIVLIGLGIWRWIKYRERRQKEISVLQQQQLTAQFENLKTQINPHFLFNSLNSLVQLIEIGDTKASEYAQTMSNFYRSLLRVGTDDTIALQQEIAMLERYLYLQKIRYGTNLIFENKISDSDIEGEQIPPLTLQMLAENVFKHNTIDVENPVTITLIIKDNQIVFSNNIRPKFHKEPSEGIGLKNINDRYRILANKQIDITSDGSHFTVKLPLL